MSWGYPCGPPSTDWQPRWSACPGKSPGWRWHDARRGGSTMITCERAGKRLAAAMADDPGVPADGELAGHLESCGPCRERERRLRELLSCFEALPREAPSPRVWSALSAGIEKELLAPAPRR